jgi:signal transduction histidine kinase
VTGAIHPVTLGQLIGLLAHDLRNPLSALHSNVGFLDSVVESRDDDVREALQDARVSCDGLMYIIDNLELLGRALSDAPDMPTTRLALMPVLEEVMARFGSDPRRPVATSSPIGTCWAGPSVTSFATRSNMARPEGAWTS